MAVFPSLDGSGLAPPDCYVPISPSHLFLSVALIIGIGVSYLPQLKIIWTRSSDGLSPWYLLLGALSSISNLFNIVVLQVPVLRCCRLVSWGQCAYNLLGLLQMVSQITMFLSIFVLFFIYFPEGKKYAGPEDNVRPTRDWRDSTRALRIVLAYSAFVAVASLLVALIFTVPSGAATTWTAALAVVALLSSLVQFIPQIFRTWKLKVVGALSVPAMMMQTPGSFLFCYTLAISPGTNFTSWITYFVGGCLQGTLLVLCLYYQETMPAEFIRIPNEEEDARCVSAGDAGSAGSVSAGGV